MTSTCLLCAHKWNRGDQTVFSWSVCHHTYCAPCAAMIINKALSNFDIPKCIGVNCHQSLDMRDGHTIKSFLEPKYQINKPIKQYLRESTLIRGYFRIYPLEAYTLSIPNEILLLTSDYLALLSIMTRIDCYGDSCYEIKTKKCDCNQTKFSDGRYVTQCTACIKVKECNICHGHGTTKSRRKRKMCKTCKGKGNILGKIAAKCATCNGSKVIVCKLCKGWGTIACQCECNGTAYLMVLDFHKLCKRQIHIATKRHLAFVMHSRRRNRKKRS
eukprot:310398_1